MTRRFVTASGEYADESKNPYTIGLLASARVVTAMAVAAAINSAFAAETPLPEYSLTLKSGEILYMAAQLREKPYKDVAELLNKIQGQLNAQDRAAADAKAAAEAPKGDDTKQ